MGSEAKAGHVLVLPFPSQGHINPLLQFSKRLVSKGVRVTLASATSHLNSMQWQVSYTNFDVEPVFDGVDNGGSETIDEYIERFNANIPRSLAELIDKFSRTADPIKCVVYDSALAWVLDVARSSGVAGCPFFTQPFAVNALYYHYLQGVLKFPLEETAVSLPAMPALEFKDLPSLIYERTSHPAICNLILSQFSNIQDVFYIFCNTFSELEHELEVWMASKWPIKPVGPAIPSMFLDKRLDGDRNYGVSFFKPSTDTCLKWLDSKDPKSVVYISFGSMAALGEDQMAEMAWGVKASNFNFIWVVRESELKKLPTNFSEQTSDKGLVVTWSPQLEVLAHDSVGCFITHCGWNSTLEALSLGVPMVAMPVWTDQPTNAKYVTDVWQVGVRVKANEKGTVTKEEIERCIREVMEGDRSSEIRKSSDKWKKLAIEAADEGGSSDKNVEEFVAKLKAFPSLSKKSAA
ncbi:hypothetical protein K2173_019226 [Erythroxylum novogranatense]|uniref:Glycosyltransferase n=1 Tax=Erythroxylum novogranatense TaxID=1862640 RepID=A0AAV8ST66_9ROSI|nr:hypothetical protein K2173_019226 [Erythroxylum novogranatense]